MNPLFNHKSDEKPIGVVTSCKIVYDNGREEEMPIGSQINYSMSHLAGLVSSSNIKELVFTIKKENK